MQCLGVGLSARMEMSNRRFDVRFDADALTEYQRLDNALVQIVDNALARLEERADEIGTPLKNKYATKLHGCKEIKLRDDRVSRDRPKSRGPAIGDTKTSPYLHPHSLPDP